jgi:hypothetical protein
MREQSRGGSSERVKGMQDLRCDSEKLSKTKQSGPAEKAVPSAMLLSGLFGIGRRGLKQFGGAVCSVRGTSFRLPAPYSILPRLLVISILAVLFITVPSADAKTVSSADLVEKCRFYNNKQVSFQGEVIGDVMIRGENAWINVNDDIYASRANVEEGSGLQGYNSGQSIWCNASEVDSIRYTGNYRNSGDIVLIEGVFHRACPEHGGDMDIHASQVELIERGHPVAHILDLRKAWIALFLAFLSVTLYLVNRFLDGRGQQTGENSVS